MSLIGGNGTGKTTLLKIICDMLPADSGQIGLGSNVKIGYYDQEHQGLSPEKTVFDEISDEYPELNNTQIRNTLAAFLFTEDDVFKRIEDLSGGEKGRVAMAKLMLGRSNFLILDEPTNHLDMVSIAWLEGFLSSYPGSVIIVSHDRYFIDKIATKIVEIDNTKAIIYHGNYTYYSDKRAEIRASQMKAYLNQQQEIKHQEAVIEKLKQFNREKSIKRAESREKMLDKIERLDKPTEVNADMRLSLSPSVESGNDVLTIKELSKSFGTNNLFSDMNLEIKRGEHVCLIGANGTGKTTILKIINRLIPKDEGQIILGSRVKVGYYDQEHQILSLHKTIFEEISDSYPDLTNTKIRNVLAAFLFTGDDVFKKIGDLSGGERGRVSLAKLMLSPANFLILDEPTNHLDIHSKEILEEAIRSYTGTVLCVSHDRYFINRISTRIVELKDKKLYSFIGNYDYYESHKDIVYAADGNISTSKGGIFAPISDNTAVSNLNSDNSSLSNKEAYLKNKEEQAKARKRENDLKKLEKEIADLEEKISKIDEEINAPENATNSKKLSDLSTEREELDTKLVEAYEKYYELEDL